MMIGKIKCARSKIVHRHRRTCKYGKICKHLERNICEFFHDPLNMEDTVMINEIIKVKIN